MFSLAILSALGSQTAIAQDEAVPDADRNLTRPELRWCVFERVRIEGESEELNQYAQWEVDRYNGTVRALNEHCQNKRHRERDHRKVESELTPGIRRTLKLAGAARLIVARAEREARRVYVKDQAAIVRTAPSGTSKEVRRVPRWGELIATGEPRVVGTRWNGTSRRSIPRCVSGGYLEASSNADPAGRRDSSTASGTLANGQSTTKL